MTMQIRIPYGKTTLTADIPDEYPVHTIEAPNPAPAADPRREVEDALDNLIGEMRWTDFRGARAVAIAVNDKTRPVPHGHLLPPLMERLAALGIPDSAITFYVAVGTHPPMTPDEFPAILPPEILARYRVVSHDSEDDSLLTYLGETSRGTPVWSNRAYTESDLKIVVGNIEPHQFAGFSGGVKTAAVGLAGLKTININHVLMTHPDSLLGAYETNPARQDIEEIGAKIGVHLALNAILNHQRQIVTALAGDPRLVMLTGLEHSRRACQVAVPQKYGLVISSPGGHPKDINVYQSQKALGHAILITRPGGLSRDSQRGLSRDSQRGLSRDSQRGLSRDSQRGTVIITAACPEGSGSQHYEAWALGKTSLAEVREKFLAEGFRIGPHKAYQFARDGAIADFCFYTEMNHDLARALLLNPIPDLQAAIDQALERLQPGEPVGFLPHAVSTIPYVQEK
jgi:nickel-dependent lactate racemase